jgi:hypothetical protein
MRDIYSLHAQTQHGGFKIVSRSNFLLLGNNKEEAASATSWNRTLWGAPLLKEQFQPR